MSFFFHSFSQFPGYDLDAAFDFVLDEFPTDFREFYGLEDKTVPEHLADDPDDWEDFKRLHAIAGRLANAAQHLVRPRRLPDTMLTEHRVLEMEAEQEEKIVRELLDRVRTEINREKWQAILQYLKTPAPGDARSKHRLFQISMQLHAVHMFFQWPGKQAERMLTLLNYLVRVRGEGTRAYLSRVAECYVREMRDEMAVMSRAVLERALSDILPEDEARKHVRISDNEVLGLSRWIKAGRNAQILDEEAERAARRIKRAGDDAVHVMPGTGPEPEVILEDIVTVLVHLERDEL